MSTWLVTGGCGFIGSHLVEALLAQGDHVRVLDDLSTGRRENVPAAAEIVVGDVADVKVVQQCMTGVDGCFHLAAVASVQRSNEAWVETHRSNLTGTVAVLDAARSARKGGKVPVVYASSAAVYGDAERMPIAESAPIKPLTAYGADKAGSELHARVAWAVHGIPTCGFRFFNVYGPRQDPKSPYSGVIAIFADHIARDETISIFGDGKQVRDFVYVKDVVRHLTAAMAAPRPDAPVFNVCTGIATSIVELAEIIGRIAGRAPRITFGKPRPGDIHTSVGDPRRARELLGVSADTRVADGLALTLNAAAQAPV
ncbi:MAG TPA: NAD-dependent epimerase/dehydratase family protein [Candidatus Cybelea sp.]|nr:NAD-dependent epimerase/dehydratase family protein [Candidatus Cybelea sp.]